MRKVFLVLVLVVFALSMAFGQTAFSPWPMLGHDMTHSGRSSYDGPLTNKIKWSTPAGGAINSSPVIGADGTIYVGSDDGKVYAFNPDKTQKWSFSTSKPVTSSPAISDDGSTIYVGSQDSNVYAINTADGKAKWPAPYQTGGQISSSPVIGPNGNIYIGSQDGKLHAINPADGKVAWPAVDVGGPINSSPAMSITGDTIYVGSSDENLYAINSNGSKKWTSGTDRYGYYSGGIISSSPVVGADGTIYFGCDNSYVFAVNSMDGGRKWAFKTGGPIKSGLAMSSDGLTVYSGSDDYKVYALNTSDGQEKWIPYLTGNKIVSSIAVDKIGNLYVGSQDGKLNAITPGGSMKWPAVPIGNKLMSSPAIDANGNLYIGSDDGKLYAFGDDTPLIILTPNGGEQWQIGTQQNITWKTAIANTGNVTIEIIEGLTLINTYDVPDTGSYLWNIPTDYNLGSDYKVKISVKNNPTITNESNNFTITGTPQINPWSMFHHDEQRTGQSPYIGPISKNVTAKSFTTGAAVYSSPAIAADGTIYVGSTDGKVYAFRSDGSQKWTKPFTTKGPVYSSPAIGPDGTIYIGSQDDNVYALNPDNGNLKWQTPYATTGDVDSSPVINSKSGIIFIGSKDGKLHAIKTADGQQLWAIPVGTSITSSPAISPDGGTIYIGSSDQQLYAVTSSGIIDWKFGTDRYGYYAGGSISSSPAVGTDGTIYIGCDNTYVFAVNPTNGGRKWAYKTGGAIKSSPAISSDGTTIYVGSSDSKLYALNTSDGQEKWISTFIGNKIESSPIVGKDGTIYVGSWDKNVYAIDPATGKEIWHYTTGDMIKSSPAISDKGVLYIGSDDKRLYSISDAAPSATITLTSPIGGEKWAIGSTQNITWTSTGNPGDIKIELLKPGTPSDIISPRILANNKSFSWTINQSEGTDYKVKISLVASPTVIDQSKADFSLIKIDDIPVQLSPSNGGTVTAPVTLAWSPVTIANSYEYEVYGPASTTVPIETNTVTTTSATIQFALIDGNTYSWRIRAIDANNLKHPFSALWTLTTSVSPPTLITPAINAIVDPINVVFTWSALTNATVYDIEMSTNANFKPSALYTTTNTSITKTLAYNTPYSWRVRAKTGNKLGAWSTVGNFTTKSFVFTSGVDAAIANSKYANQLLGIGVINNTGSLQTAVVEQPVNRQSECYIMIKNTGNVEDKFLISSTSAINSKWKVYVYDISGINRTVNVFNGGWTSYSVKPGECVKLLLRFAVASGQKVDESNPQTQSISITAQSWKDINSNAANIASDTVTGTAILTKMSKMN